MLLLFAVVCPAGCRDSPCTACNKCLASMQAFVSTTGVNTANPGNLASAFQSYCQQTGRSAPICSGAAAAISGSFQGNVGRRAALLCAALSECDRSSLGFSCK
jgi:hypothetical protein